MLLADQIRWLKFGLAPQCQRGIAQPHTGNASKFSTRSISYPLTTFKAHLDFPESMQYRSSNKPGVPPNEWCDPKWHAKIKVSYERLLRTLWYVTREFDICGYGQVLREKLTTSWCNCGCSTDHLGEVCEGTLR